MKGIAEMTANFLIPCLSVAEICKSFHISKYELWLPILIYCIFNLGIGYLIGEIICFFIRGIKPETRRLVLITCMFSNSTSMQLIYVDSLGAILGKMINSSETDAKSKGYVIVLLYTIFVNFFRWSIGFNLMKPDKKSQSYLKSLEKINYENGTEISIDSTATYRKGKIVDIESREVSISTSDDSNSHIETLKKEKFESFMKIIKEGINMPFIAGIAAIILASIPYVNTFFSDKESIGFKLLIGKKKF
jgi:predicted permease